MRETFCVLQFYNFSPQWLSESAYMPIFYPKIIFNETAPRKCYMCNM